MWGDSSSATPRSPRPGPRLPLPRALASRAGIAGSLAAALIVASLVILTLGVGTVRVVGTPKGLPSSYPFPLPGPSSESSLAYGAISSNLSHWAATFRGGGWSVLGAGGYAIPPSLVPGPVNASAFVDINSGGSCNYVGLTSANQTFVIPATRGNLTVGNASFWRIDLTGNQNRVLTVVEIRGAFYPLALGTCPSNTSAVFQATTPAVVDSSVAASVAWTAGGQTFAAGHATYIVGYGVGAGIDFMGRYFPPQWTVDYAVCSHGVVFSPSPAFQATVNATTGTFVSASWPPTAGCPPTA